MAQSVHFWFLLSAHLEHYNVLHIVVPTQCQYIVFLGKDKTKTQLDFARLKPTYDISGYIW